MALNNFGRNIKALREKFDLTQSELAEKLDVTQNTVSGWETREKLPRSKDTIHKIEDMFGVTYRDLYGFSDGLYAQMHGLTQTAAAVPSDSYAPVIGDIAAGDPSEAFEYSGEKLWIPPELLERDPDTFYLRIRGDSMDQTDFRSGTYAAISPNSLVSNGDIAAVKVNGDDATIKVYENHDGVIILTPQSSDPQYKRIVIDSSDPDAPYFKVLGKAIWPYYPIRH